MRDRIHRDALLGDRIVEELREQAPNTVGLSAGGFIDLLHDVPHTAARDLVHAVGAQLRRDMLGPEPPFGRDGAVRLPAPASAAVCAELAGAEVGARQVGHRLERLGFGGAAGHLLCDGRAFAVVDLGAKEASGHTGALQRQPSDLALGVSRVVDGGVEDADRDPALLVGASVAVTERPGFLACGRDPQLQPAHVAVRVGHALSLGAIGRGPHARLGAAAEG